jgi:shikimate kinase
MATFRTSRVVSAAELSAPHVVLVGLPGSGKTTVGLMVAERLGRAFLDFDAEIELREAMTISQIFGEKGEGHFRGLERKLTEELRELGGGMVVAPGGGWITNPEIVALIRPPAKLVYLRVRPETALKRLGSAAGTRPLLSRPDPLGEIKSLFESRRTLYQLADHEIGAELLTPQQVTEQIVALVRGPGTPS